MGEHEPTLCFLCANEFPLDSLLLTFDPEVKQMHGNDLQIRVSPSQFETLIQLIIYFHTH